MTPDPPRPPLATVTSIKVKLGLLVATSVLVAAVLGTVAAAGGVAWWLAIPVAVGLALGVTQLLATGMTSPLRQMTEAAGRMARGDYDVRVDADTGDEVGRLAQAFNTMAQDLAAVDRERRDLVAMVSHELRTPLTALGARLENLVDGVEPASPEVLAELLEQTRRLGALVRDLLDLSRTDAGMAPLRLAEVPLTPLLRRAVADVALAGRDVDIAVEAEPEDLVVVADGERLRQLVTNLVENAVRHSPPGGRVTVSTATGPDGWSLEVRDRGSGVRPEDRERAFERFGTLDTSGGGTGLGLAIARSVAEQHGGTLHFVDPEPGEGGARARLELPRVPAAPDEPTTAGEESAMPAPPKSVRSSASPESPRPVVPGPSGPPPVLPPVAGMDALFGAFWPEEGVPGRRDLLLASAAVGVLAAWVLPFRPTGLGLFLVLAFSGLVVAAASTSKRDWFTMVCAALSALLTSMVLLRDADWVIALCILTGAALMLAGATRARSVVGFLLSGLAWPLAGLRGMPWLGRSARGLTGGGSTPALLRTLIWSLLGLGVFGVLFASADALFAHWVDAVLPDWTPDSFVGRAFLAVAVAGVVLAAAYVAFNPPRIEPAHPRAARPVTHRFEWLAPVLLVDAVFVVFLVAQAAAFFGGHDYLERTTGLTYAQYVHQGFGQLTVATALTLGVVAAAVRKAPRETLADRLWLRVALGALCVMTLVVVASALYRMHLYQEAYGFTRLRLLVDVFEGWLGLVVLLVMLAGVRLAGGWVPRAALLSGAAAIAGLAVLNPDAWIARHNVERFAETGKIDWAYLQGLSSDAVPGLEELSTDQLQCAVSSTFDDGDWLSWNLGRSRAQAALEGVPEDEVGWNCPLPIQGSD